LEKPRERERRLDHSEMPQRTFNRRTPLIRTRVSTLVDILAIGGNAFGKLVLGEHVSNPTGFGNEVIVFANVVADLTISCHLVPPLHSKV